MRRPGLAGDETAILILLDDYGGNFEQRIRVGVETAGFDVDDDRQKTAKTFRDRGIWLLI
jgi:hypothetical protein